MSEENLEVVRRIYAELELGNFGALVEFMDPEIVLESFMPDSSERVVAHGLEEIRAFMREVFVDARDYRLIGEEFRVAGEDGVFVAGRQAATGRQSGVAVESPGFTIWVFRNGKVVRLIFETDRGKALEAAGLSE